MMHFEGQEPTLKGFIFNYVGERAPDQCLKMVKEIATYVRKTYTEYTGDLIKGICTLTLVDPAEPVPPDPGNLAAFEVWTYEFKEYQT